MKTAFVLALVAASFSGAVLAKDVSKKTMDDAAMEQVTGGSFATYGAYISGHSNNGQPAAPAQNLGFKGDRGSEHGSPRCAISCQSLLP